jgi:site-specific DNA-methyltransferase (adenine-specific)
MNAIARALIASWHDVEDGRPVLWYNLAPADPGQVVCDPFVGGGTTGVVALAHGCSFIGAEIDQVAYETALARLAS